MKLKVKKKTKLKIAICLLIFIYIFFSASKLIIDAGGEDFNSSVSNCSYYAIKKCINLHDLSDLCSVEKNKADEIQFVKTNSLKINAVLSDLALDCYDYLSELIAKGYDVPIGAFTGFRLLAGVGPKINVKIITVLSVQCDIVREFVSVGINQTHLTLSCVIRSDLIAYSLFDKKKYTSEIEVTIYDNYIVGKIPETFLASEIIASKTEGKSK